MALLSVSTMSAEEVVSGLLKAEDTPRRDLLTESLLLDPRVQRAVVERLCVEAQRLLGVDPPARGEICGAADCGAAAANMLAGLVRQKPVSCALQGKDGTGHALGRCNAAGTDLNLALVASGWARAANGRADLRQAETGARADRRGLWANPLWANP